MGGADKIKICFSLFPLYMNMLLKRKWVIGNTNYYRTRIRMTLENANKIYDICTDCKFFKYPCTYKSSSCMYLNFKLSRNKILYRYFPYASKKEKRITTY